MNAAATDDAIYTAIILVAICSYLVIRFAIGYYFDRKTEHYQELYNLPMED